MLDRPTDQMSQGARAKTQQDDTSIVPHVVLTRGDQNDESLAFVIEWRNSGLRRD